MNGAESVLRTLAAAGVRTCFANPGTSELHLVGALDRVPEVRGVLALFEGVVSGAADGYGRMADAPAATLLHLGPGLGNAFANLHNARRARTPVVNLVGEHAGPHLHLDAPLTSDIAALARSVGWVRTSSSARGAPLDAADAVAAARSGPGQVASLVLPADATWEDSPGPAAPVAPTPRPRSPDAAVAAAHAALRSGEPAALLLGHRAVRDPGLDAAHRIAAATGARVIADTFTPRMRRGGGRPPVERLPYFTAAAVESLAGLRHIIAVETGPPVAFFALPGLPSQLTPEGCAVHVLATPAEDGAAALEALADALGAPATPPRATAPAGAGGALPTGALDGASLAAVVGALLPEGAIVSDEGVTAGLGLFGATNGPGAPEHDWLSLMGGAIGQGLPVATGAAVACPDRKVISFEGDGSAMYTIQSLWTQARESLDVTTVILSNRSYAILAIEFERVGAQAGGDASRALLDIGRPDLDFVRLAEGLGVPAERVEDAEGFARAFARAVAEPGPQLIEALL
jgi:acetolactate synthase-1/2/3 large subunit